MPLASIIEFVGPNGALQLFGVKFVGVNTENGRKVLFTLGVIVGVWLLSAILRGLVHLLFRGVHNERVRFWIRQAIHLFTALVLVVGFLSIWFDDPTRLGTFLGLVTAGLAFALQRVITAFAGYLLILRGKTFNVGDRITMGGVRGDVVALGFLQTTIMEMGQPPSVQNADPAMWVRARQYSGRLVTVTNAKIFDEPVFNYTREFPFLWEELMIPVGYTADWRHAEQILLDTAHRHTQKISELSEPDLTELERRYATRRSDLRPRVFMRLTDNWVELTVRFIVQDHAIRDVKDAMARDILQAFATAKISVASGTYDIVGLPEIKVRMEPGQQADGQRRGGVSSAA
ncbi:MAG TPA: mechanosensitive ion channel family protein [Phycisphaerae bacterium]|nr:mechanosensitive ion channel family protein [Phycisphaerae bacterium]